MSWAGSEVAVDNSTRVGACGVGLQGKLYRSERAEQPVYSVFSVIAGRPALDPVIRSSGPHVLGSRQRPPTVLSLSLPDVCIRVSALLFLQHKLTY